MRLTLYQKTILDWSINRKERKKEVELYLSNSTFRALRKLALMNLIQDIEIHFSEVTEKLKIRFTLVDNIYNGVI